MEFTKEELKFILFSLKADKSTTSKERSKFTIDDIDELIESAIENSSVAKDLVEKHGEMTLSHMEHHNLTLKIDELLEDM